MITIVCYLDEGLGLCPVKEYLEQFDIDDQGSAQASSNLSTLIDIDTKIRHVAEHNGQAPPISKPISGYKHILEIHAARKNKDYLIRVVYIRHDKHMVLLHIFEKLDNYRTKKEREDIQKEFQTAEKYAKKFKNNPTLYESYE